MSVPVRPDTPPARPAVPSAANLPLLGFTVLLLCQAVGEALSRLLHLPFPGPVVGMMLLLPALRSAWVRAAVVPAAQFLLAHLALLFVPVGVGVMGYVGLLADHGFRLLAVIALSTWAGMAATLWALRWRGRDEDGQA